MLTSRQEKVRRREPQGMVTNKRFAGQRKQPGT